MTEAVGIPRATYPTTPAKDQGSLGAAPTTRWCRKPGSATVPEWLGRALGMELGLAEPWLHRAGVQLPMAAGLKWGSGPCLGWGEALGEAGQGQGGPMLVPHGPDSMEVTPCALRAVTEQLPDTRLQPWLKVLKHKEEKTVCKSLAGKEEAFGFGFFAFGRQRAYSA